MTRTAVIDYGMGNLGSVARALEECGADVVITDQAEELGTCSRMVLPGVGSFADGMRHMRERGLDQAIRNHVLEQGVPLLGLCLGMHLLAEHGHEGGYTAGLGLIPGQVVRMMPDSVSTRIPHVGWNEVHSVGTVALLDGIGRGKDFYFVHSYHFVCDDPEHVVATTPYCGGIVSVVRRENVMGVQFHPEKSQRVGLQLLANFLRS